MPVVAFRFLKLDLKPELSDTVRVHGCRSGHRVLTLRRGGSTWPCVSRCATLSWYGRSRRHSTGACSTQGVWARAALAMPSPIRRVLGSSSCLARTCDSAPWHSPALPPAPAPAGLRPCGRGRAAKAAVLAAPVVQLTRLLGSEAGGGHIPCSAAGGSPPLPLGRAKSLVSGVQW